MATQTPVQDAADLDRQPVNRPQGAAPSNSEDWDINLPFPGYPFIVVNENGKLFDGTPNIWVSGIPAVVTPNEEIRLIGQGLGVFNRLEFLDGNSGAFLDYAKAVKLSSSVLNFQLPNSLDRYVRDGGIISLRLRSDKPEFNKKLKQQLRYSVENREGKKKRQAEEGEPKKRKAQGKISTDAGGPTAEIRGKETAAVEDIRNFSAKNLNQRQNRDVLLAELKKGEAGDKNIITQTIQRAQALNDSGVLAEALRITGDQILVAQINSAIKSVRTAAEKSATAAKAARSAPGGGTQEDYDESEEVVEEGAGRTEDTFVPPPVEAGHYASLAKFLEDHPEYLAELPDGQKILGAIRAGGVSSLTSAQRIVLVQLTRKISLDVENKATPEIRTAAVRVRDNMPATVLKAEAQSGAGGSSVAGQVSAEAEATGGAQPGSATARGEAEISATGGQAASGQVQVQGQSGGQSLDHNLQIVGEFLASGNNGNRIAGAEGDVKLQAGVVQALQQSNPQGQDAGTQASLQATLEVLAKGGSGVPAEIQLAAKSAIQQSSEGQGKGFDSAATSKPPALEREAEGQVNYELKAQAGKQEVPAIPSAQAAPAPGKGKVDGVEPAGQQQDRATKLPPTAAKTSPSNVPNELELQIKQLKKMDVTLKEKLGLPKTDSADEPEVAPPLGQTGGLGGHEQSDQNEPKDENGQSTNENLPGAEKPKEPPVQEADLPPPLRAPKEQLPGPTAPPAAPPAAPAAPAAEAGSGALAGAAEGAEAGAAGGPQAALAGAALGALASSKAGQELIGKTTSQMWWWGFGSSAAFFFTGLDFLIGAAVMDIYWWRHSSEARSLVAKNSAGPEGGQPSTAGSTPVIFPMKGWQKVVTVFANVFPLFLLFFFTALILVVGCNYPFPVNTKAGKSYRLTVVGAFIGDQCSVFDISNFTGISSSNTPKTPQNNLTY